MTKANDAARKRQTHFEQVPLDVVKQVIKEGAPKAKRTEIGDVSNKPASPRKSTASESMPARSLYRNGR
jgi:hypothetical protein